MRKQLFMYLFLFAVLYIVFQYMNAKKAFEEMDELAAQVEDLKMENSTLTAKITNIEENVDSLEQENHYLNYFSLTENADAISYFGKRGFDVETIATKIENQIMDNNKAGHDNVLVPFSGMVGPMRVNHIEILNHRWLIADFTDGVYWGEMLLKYQVGDNGNITFTTMESFLYPGRR